MTLPPNFANLGLSPKRPLDGAMGTELLRLYGPPRDGRAFVAWNQQFPEEVADVHGAYAEAGSSLLTTNTLLAPMLPKVGPRLTELGVALSRVLARNFRLTVALSLGPGGAGPSVYAGLAATGTAAGAHFVQLETFTDAAECARAVRAVRAALPDIPVVALLVFASDGHTLGCRTPAGDAARLLLDAGADAVGANCSAPDEMRPAVAAMHAALPCDIPLVLRPSAGIPCRIGERERHPWAPSPWAAAVRSLAESAAPGRAVLLGGCCGAGPSHTAALASALAPPMASAAAAVFP